MRLNDRTCKHVMKSFSRLHNALQPPTEERKGKKPGTWSFFQPRNGESKTKEAYHVTRVISKERVSLRRREQYFRGGRGRAPRMYAGRQVGSRKITKHFLSRNRTVRPRVRQSAVLPGFIPPGPPPCPFPKEHTFSWWFTRGTGLPHFPT